MELTLGISPCPNDTFAFGAAIHGYIDTEGLRFNTQLSDIKELNLAARTGIFDVCKVSFFAYQFIRNHYTLLEAGAALGRGVGPLIVAKTPMTAADLGAAKIALPGRDTTAHLLLNFFAPHAMQRQEMLFHQIMPAVAQGRVDAGVVIHESRFTYQEHDLHLVQDLGEYWESETGLPIPLGGIVAQKRLGEAVIAKLNRVLRKSVEFAFAHPTQLMPYVAEHAQELSEDVMRKHIALYVNDFSVDLGPEGHAAVDRLLQEAQAIEVLGKY